MTIIESLLFSISGELQVIISLLTLLVVCGGLFSLKYQKKEIQYTTIQKCIEIHRNILRNQQELEIPGVKVKGLYAKRRILIRDHLGLVTEELFYMKKGYLPKQISKNWLEHMIGFVPLTYEGKVVYESEESIKKSKEIRSFDYNEYINLAKDKKTFTQIYKVFKINYKLYNLLENYGMDDQFVRNKLVNYLFRKAKNK
ncbi:MAG: hypothetical protein GQ564_21845 [Bacteroidales bacterium]|nr:hypothetical protein [Bacteroidales bacterium]